MLSWIKKVLVKHTKGRHALLVFDMFKIHLKDDILKENNISQVLILGGCKSKIQPLDVCLNKTFTAYIRGVCEEYKAGQAQSTHIASQIPQHRGKTYRLDCSCKAMLNFQANMIKSLS